MVHLTNSRLTQRITLQDLEFFAYHGWYPNEQVEGNTFFVTLSISYMVPDFLPLDEREELSNTVNYEFLYECIDVEMKATKKLLETVCQSIIQRILQQLPNLSSIEVSISKKKLSFVEQERSTTVSLRWDQ
jgi:dihydroneopterin aldolase